MITTHEIRAIYDQLKDAIFAPTRPYPMAVRHPNGFIVVTFEPTKRDAPQLRLHLWTDQSADSDIHDHAWDFESLCLFGAMTMTRYTRGRDGTNFRHYICQATRAIELTKSFVFRDAGEQQLVAVGDIAIQAGTRYKLRSNELHGISMKHKRGPVQAITLVERTAYVRDFTNVFVPHGEDGFSDLIVERASERVTFADLPDETSFVLSTLEEILSATPRATRRVSVTQEGDKFFPLR